VDRSNLLAATAARVDHSANAHSDDPTALPRCQLLQVSSSCYIQYSSACYYALH
jgi:hypothetical protein